MTEYQSCPHGKHIGAYCGPCLERELKMGDKFADAFEALADGVGYANELGKKMLEDGINVAAEAKEKAEKDIKRQAKEYEEVIRERLAKFENKPTGLHAEYYDLPDNVRSAQDLIEYLNLDFANGNILKSLIREHGTQTKATDALYEAEKRYYFAKRHLQRVQREQEVRRRLPDDASGDETP